MSTKTPGVVEFESFSNEVSKIARKKIVVTKEQASDPEYMGRTVGRNAAIAGGISGGVIGALLNPKNRPLGAAIGAPLSAAASGFSGYRHGVRHAKQTQKKASIDKEAVLGRLLAGAGKKLLSGASKGLGSAARAAKPGGALQSAALKGQGTLLKGQMAGSKALGGGALGAKRLNQTVGGAALGMGALGTAVLAKKD